MTAVKCLLSAVLLISALVAYTSSERGEVDDNQQNQHRRRLSMIVGDTIPKYMEALTKDLRERKKLFDETPPEEVKYWFEYTGPLQVSGKLSGDVTDVFCYVLKK